MKKSEGKINYICRELYRYKECLIDRMYMKSLMGKVIRATITNHYLFKEVMEDKRMRKQLIKELIIDIGEFELRSIFINLRLDFHELNK